MSSLAMIIIFMVDLYIPLGVAVGVMYVCCIALLLREKKDVTLKLSLLATFLTSIIPVLTFDERTTWMAFVNRGISILSIWILYIIAVQHKKLNDEKASYIKKLEQNNKEQEQFIYITSHDLQEPLNTISSFTSILKDKYSSVLDETGKKCVNYIHLSSQRMSTLIKDLLEYGRIGRRLILEEVDCNLLVKEVLEDLHQKIEANNASILINDLPMVNVIKNEFGLLFQNLISNAIKFGPIDDHPIIEINAVRKQNSWVFSVKDNGIGIDQQHHNKIFIIFQRLHSSHEYKGTGIGLAHCKKIVDLHHGKIWVESTLGKGTTFYFEIPISQS
ncbi:GHKL domain-containing protein [Flammeovirga yaeyamensis]|uniref:histidine kinase n=1 Tax=Flammeovirga yaeyamensis TaxID=367791 RepID=A0AAX1NBA0_9BACT|nr:ATP-binding protein [Flammeovirga yaeyamensis]MBB3697243.1 light-regulated signal transduction histidine kinase (bacteriophytochrome) [Flammeovirga yaeyamensis]NMF33901.1 GHKL domain-containing protein [Flammeovirga yaeyamensis]QWG04839.1 GHKL domain-containing protein [Flammeovirga yaeyamensis]